MMSCPRFKFFKEELRYEGRSFATRIEARASLRGEEYGRIIVKANGGEPSVSHVVVHEQYKRCGLGTKLYEEAAKLACKKYKGPLRSDVERSEAAEGFWQKQVKKGRAHCVETVHPAQPKSGDPIVGRNGCWKYILTCPAPATLAKPPRRR